MHFTETGKALRSRIQANKTVLVKKEEKWPNLLICSKLLILVLVIIKDTTENPGP